MSNLENSCETPTQVNYSPEKKNNLNDRYDIVSKQCK